MRTLRQCGAEAVIVDCADATDALRLWRRLDRRLPSGVSEVVLGAVTVLVVGAVGQQLRDALRVIAGAGDALAVDADGAGASDAGAGDGVEGSGAARTGDVARREPDRPGGGAPGREPAAAPPQAVEIAVRYDGEDLEAVAAATGLPVAEVVRRHHAAEFTVAFAGFVPGFAYLTGLDSSLWLPRRSSPRSRVPRGAVAIADRYGGVYPVESPGGWHLLGATDALMFDADADPPALLRPGQHVRFVPQR